MKYGEELYVYFESWYLFGKFYRESNESVTFLMPDLYIALMCPGIHSFVVVVERIGSFCPAEKASNV